MNRYKAFEGACEGYMECSVRRHSVRGNIKSSVSLIGLCEGDSTQSLKGLYESPPPAEHIAL